MTDYQCTRCAKVLRHRNDKCSCLDDGMEYTIERLTAEVKKLEDELYKSSVIRDVLRDSAEQLTAEVEKLKGENKQVRFMFNATRQRVLREIGEKDKGKSWNWIESKVAELEAEIKQLRTDKAYMQARIDNDWQT